MRIILPFFISLLSLHLSAQQKIPIRGAVYAEDNTPLSGVSVNIKGGNEGTATLADGTFSIAAAQGAILVFTSVGYEEKEVRVTNANSANAVTMIAGSSSLGEVVVVGYGTQKKETVTGSIASVKGEQLTVAPVASTSNALAGRLPGLISQQPSGRPGADAANLRIRGFGSALVIVDGVEASFDNIDANEIESISILKDGAASIYGSRAGNGVILVTTKRGVAGKPVISLNTSKTFQSITVMPKPASSGQYAELRREAWIQAGQPAETAPFTEEQVQKYYDATDPLYPNTDWYDYLLRDWSPQQQHNLSVRGGTEQIRYYGFFGFLDQESMWKRNGGNYKRFNLQSNIDAKISEQLSLQLNFASVYEIRDYPWRPQEDGNAWQDYWETLPIYPTTLPDPTKISFANGAGTGGAHVTTNSEISGYNNTASQNIRGTLALTYVFKRLRGLSAKAFVNTTQDYSTLKQFTKPVEFYTYDPASDEYTLAGAFGSKAALSIVNSRARTITGQFSLNFDRTFNDDHHITALALYEAIDYNNDYNSATRINFLTPAIDQLFAGSTAGMTNDGSATEMGRTSYVARVNYLYRSKYLLETILRADATAKFPPGKRWGYFPSISAGWRLSEENFMQSVASLDNLKLRLSYGQSGNDGVGNFQYLSGYQYGHTYILDNAIQPGIVSTGLANPYLTWEKIMIYNAGLEFSFWNRKLYGEADVFYRKREGIPTTRIATLPSSFGSALPPENINSLNDRGFELKLGTAGYRGDLSWDLSGNISWSRSKWDHYEEPQYPDPDQQRIYQQSGRWRDRQFGYLSDGLFTSDREIETLPFNQDNQGNISLRPGDIRYKDVNEDGILDWKDQVEIGKGTVPHSMLGFNANLKYRNFDLSLLIQGAFGYYNYIVLYRRATALQPAIMYDLRWTPENNDPNASIPRLGGASTNGLTSDFYYEKAGYVRLKAFSLGYNLPTHLLNKLRFEQIRVFVSGNNLLTFDKLKKYQTDPEAPSGQSGYYYPQQKAATIGLNISL